jgi:hypothetical protein
LASAYAYVSDEAISRDRQALALTLSLAVAVSPAMAASNGVALLKAVAPAANRPAACKIRN